MIAPSAGASGPQPQDDYAFSYQFDGMLSKPINAPLLPSSKVVQARHGAHYPRGCPTEACYIEHVLTWSLAEVDRAYENLQKSGKGYGMGGRRELPKQTRMPVTSRPLVNRRGGLADVMKASTNEMALPALRADARVSHGSGHRSHATNNFDEARGGPQGQNLHNFYASQRHQPSRGNSEAEQVMQLKRRMAAQRERELRNLHTEQQYQRSRPPSAV